MFTLWKYALLNKRILFYSSPPLKDLCDRVVCSIEMINTNFEYITKKQLIKPHFYVHVTDIDELQKEPFYLACSYSRKKNPNKNSQSKLESFLKAQPNEFSRVGIFYTTCLWTMLSWKLA